MRLSLVRHGESEGNVAGALQGSRLDTPLSSRGRRQAESLSIRLAQEPIDFVVTSPMSRARETAQILAAPHGLGVRLDPDLVEFDWGFWTGRPLDEDMERQVGDLRARWRSGDVEVTAPGGESPVAAEVRASRFLERLRSERAQGPLVVAHGRFNRILMTVLLRRHLSRMDEIRQRNGSLSLFDWSDSGAVTALLLDGVDHLEKNLLGEIRGNESVR